MTKYFIAIGILFFGSRTYCQNLNYQQTLTDSIKKIYNQCAYSKYGYLNGREYKPYYNPVQSTPIFKGIMWTGTIYHNGFAYPGLKLNYDTYLDEVIVLPELYISSSKYIQINKNYVDSFRVEYNLKSYLFEKLTFENNELPNGYYEIAYKGKTTLIIKHTPTVLVQEGITMYHPHKESYIIEDENIFSISKKKDLLTLYEKHKKEIKQRIKNQSGTYKKLSNDQLADLIRYIESL